MGLFNLLGDIIGGIFNALTKAGAAYDSSKAMSDDQLRDRMESTSDSFVRAGYYRRYKENHPEIYGDKKDK